MDLALLLLTVGMSTVFLVLFIVVFVGNGIILFVNKYIPETTTKKDFSNTTTSGVGEISKEKMTAITMAVSIATQGKASVLNVTRI